MKDSNEKARHTNELINETSPYLLQHAHNPVNWMPWGDKALEKARKENKPIFLSIGYSSCHWCHVMERESFENEEIAEVLNKDFIPIKVDREERPDLDSIYMNAVQMMTGSGGWPLNVFLTPDLKPFYGGTYFPPESKFGRPGFKALLLKIAGLWKSDRKNLQENANVLAASLNPSRTQPVGPLRAKQLSSDILDQALKSSSASFDPEWGGFGSAPKFPQVGVLELFLRMSSKKGAALPHEATFTLDKMASGGMRDQIGGGFHRYSVDRMWLVPHFEKMLYDNALLSKLYFEAYQLTGKPLYLQVARETLDYVLRDMTDKDGGFYSAEDADSEGVEGKYYIWDKEEILSLLGKKDADLFDKHYGVTASGNFEDANILYLPEPPEEFAKKMGITEKDLESRMKPMKEKLFAARHKRIPPGKDDKVIASWNGMMISSFVKGYQITRDKRYLSVALNAGKFIIKKMMRDGELLRSYRKGQSRQHGYLDDYANVINAFIDLYEASFDVFWLDEGKSLANKMIKLFKDDEGHGFFLASERHKNLIARTKPFMDSSIPSGNAVAVMALLRLSRFFNDDGYYKLADEALKAEAARMNQYPGAFAHMLNALDFCLAMPTEIVIAGKVGAKDTNKLLEVVNKTYMPNKILAFAPDSGKGSKKLLLLKDRKSINGKAAAYVCENFACKAPVTDPEEFKRILEAVRK